MPIKTIVGIVGAVALVGVGVLAVSQQARIRSLDAAEAGVARRAQEAADQLARRRAADSAAVTQLNRARRAELADRVHFGFNQAMIRPTDAEILDEKISILKADPGMHIRIIGHCDERGTEIYNLALGRRRAAAAREYLLQHGVDGSRIETVSAGKGRPLYRQHDARAWSQNRRDEFEMIDGGALVGLEP